MKPFLSIVIPVYNMRQFASYAVESALQQDDAEVIVFDDGSMDGLKDDMERKGGIRFFPRAENRGIAATLNEAIRQARGEWVICFDADDIMGCTLSQELQVAVLNHSEADYFYYRLRNFTESASKSSGYAKEYPESLFGEDFAKVFRQGTLFKLSQVAIRRDVFDKLSFDENLRYCVNSDFWLQLLAAGKRGYLIDKELMLCRVHASGNSGGIDGLAKAKFESLNVFLKWWPYALDEGVTKTELYSLHDALILKFVFNAIASRKRRVYVSQMGTYEFHSPSTRRKAKFLMFLSIIFPRIFLQKAEELYYAYKRHTQTKP